MQRHLALLFSFLLCWHAASVSALQLEDEELEYVPGLQAVYRTPQATVSRIDDDISFSWGESSPDSRLPNGPFEVEWEGRLFVRRGSSYFLRAYVCGEVQLLIEDKVVLSGNSSKAAWIHSDALELDFGFHPLRIRYKRTAPDAQIRLFWESEQFELEPISSESLYRDAASVESTPKSSGEALVRSRRCTACHELPVQWPALAAPSLNHLKGAIHADWLVGYLQNPGEKKANVAMPQFGLTSSQAQAIAAYLMSAGKSPSLEKTRSGDSKQGKSLVENLGCLACHQLDGKGKDAPFGGGDLSQIAAKRPAQFFATWLRNPEKLNPQHRMPVFDLSSKEVNDIAAYLASLGDSKADAEKFSTSMIEQGKSLIEAKRCASCHEIPGVKAGKDRSLLTMEQEGCLGDADPEKHRPGYAFSSADRSAVVEYLQSLPKEPATVAETTVGRRLLSEKGCLNCHSRGNEDGLREVVAQLGVTDPKAQAALVPPSLNSLGDKMQPEWLNEAIAGKATRLRPWLAPRMPKFKHSDEERDALLAYFISHDLIPEQPRDNVAADNFPNKQELLLGAHQLVGASGMGCMSCHTIGSYEPKGVELGARGSDLRFLGKRIRQSWFRRWTRNPSRIVPGVEMPAITLANPSILDGKIATQLEALWEGLNAPQFDLPTADAVQLLTAKNAKRTLILRDPFEHGEADYTTRSFAVGLLNGHNLLIDLDTFSLRRWWVGDFARQKTRGKTWYWETAGVTLYDNAEALSLLAMQAAKANQLIQPHGPEQAVCRLESYQHLKDGVQLRLRLHFGETVSDPIDFRIRSTEGGFVFETGLSSVSTANAGQLVFQFPKSNSVVYEEGVLQTRSPFGNATVSAANAGSQFTQPPLATAAYLLEPTTPSAAVAFTTPITPPFAANQQLPFALAPQAKELPCMPGYEVIRQPVPDGPMPTALAWTPDGKLVAASLKGEVYLVKDTDGDGLLDAYSQYSDYLAAPYGLYADEEGVLVSHKPELVRLKDEDGDGFAERTQVVASGWGVTFDYHDWAVGILRDKDGNWYVSPSCQQDDRTIEAAKGRGKVLKVAPTGEVTEFAAGIRFAMGLAMNERGDIFATDNQGVTNPFNELNHIQQGHHYAFWSKLEPRPEGQVTTRPAIQIPHPWTRSVNAITFIPDNVDFGPFAGHLIGADYTTRKLVRMSLQPIGDTYQGCAYPFSVEDLKLVEEDNTFLGPISMAFGPDGALYVGSMIDSGWGGGNNRGTLERVRFRGAVPFGIREVRAHSQGFDIDFTGDVDPALAVDPSQYTLSCYQRIHQGGYATPDQDRTNVRIQRVELSKDKRSVRLYVEPLRPTFVYDIAIASIHGAREKPFPDVAYYTLNVVPSSDEGK